MQKQIMDTVRDNGMQIIKLVKMQYGIGVVGIELLI